MKILFELRPALDGHAGIPQEARLLFRGLSTLPQLQVEGLIQSSNRVLAKGLPPSGRDFFGRELPLDRQVNRLSRVVVSMQYGQPGYVELGLSWIKLALSPLTTAARTMLGGRQVLTRFEAARFKDFVWRAMFAKTLPNDDFDVVTAAPYRVARVPWAGMHSAALLTKRFGHAVYPRLDTRGFDVMLAETPYPGRVARGTRMVVRYHDAIPLLMPHTISDKSYHQASHYHALKRNVQDGAWFACVSESTRKDLVSIFPEVAPRAVTIPNMVSHHYRRDDSPASRVPEILRIRRNAQVDGAASGGVITRGPDGFPYLLMVSTIEPRKNHLTLLAAWEYLRAHGHPDLHLVFVGSLGWDHKAIVRKLRPWLARGGLHMLEDVPADELRALYHHARVTVCPSYGEGFDYSGIEAMRCGGVVAASDIPVHRDVFGEAAEYFSPYAAPELARAVTRLLGPEAAARRTELQALGDTVSAQYDPARVLPLWSEFLAQLPPAP